MVAEGDFGHSRVDAREEWTSFDLLHIVGQLTLNSALWSPDLLDTRSFM